MSTVSTADLQRWVAALPSLSADVEDSERVAQLTLLEQLKSVCAAVQATVTAAFRDSRRADADQRNIPRDRTDRSIAAQIALARHESPVQGRRHLALADALTGPLPHTLTALRSGHISEWRATLIARATRHLSDADCATVDAEIAPQLATLGDRRTHDVATAMSYRLDPDGALARTRKAVTDRHVTVRPAPDSMAYLSALLPMTRAVAVYAALHRDATTINLAEGNRTKAQIMADELVRRATHDAVDGCDQDGIPDRIGGGLRINLVMTDRTLLDSDDDAAQLAGYGPIPAPLARKLASAVDSQAGTWVRRLYARPGTGELCAMDSRARLFPEALRTLVKLRDRTCRTPWCDAPISDTDHIEARHDGGPTNLLNSQGLCQNCNLTKETGGWVHDRHPDGGVEISTPMRVIYQSPPRPAPGFVARV